MFSADQSVGRARYSAKNQSRAVNFLCMAPKAKAVFLAGSFNNWDVHATAMKRQPDGGWHAQVALPHGHHQYLFVIDGVAHLDPRAQGKVRLSDDSVVSMIAVS
jgi:1,4-alpha-glucan branching enzyme